MLAQGPRLRSCAWRVCVCVRHVDVASLIHGVALHDELEFLIEVIHEELLHVRLRPRLVLHIEEQFHHLFAVCAPPTTRRTHTRPGCSFVRRPCCFRSWSSRRRNTIWVPVMPQV